MSSRSKNIDLGPMYMPIGEETDIGRVFPCSRHASSLDASRFQAALNESSSDCSLNMRLWIDDATQVLATSKPVDGCPTDSLEMEIERLWVGTGVHSQREVRIRLSASVLPDTDIRFTELGGELTVEFTCGSQMVAAMLLSKLTKLSEDLTGRLGRSVKTIVVSPHNVNELNLRPLEQRAC